MAYIKVDHSRFDSAASAIDSYVADMKKKMGSANGEVTTLTTNWQGNDANQFKTQWNKVTANDSTYCEMVKALESYAKYLRFAAKTYRDAQAKAINRANGLPRY